MDEARLCPSVVAWRGRATESGGVGNLESRNCRVAFLVTRFDMCRRLIEFGWSGGFFHPAGVGDAFDAIRQYRFARLPATCWHPFRMFSGVESGGRTGRSPAPGGREIGGYF